MALIFTSSTWQPYSSTILAGIHLSDMVMMLGTVRIFPEKDFSQ